MRLDIGMYIYVWHKRLSKGQFSQWDMRVFHQQNVLKEDSFVQVSTLWQPLRWVWSECIERLGWCMWSLEPSLNYISCWALVVNVNVSNNLLNGQTDCLDLVMLLLTVKVRNRFNTFAITVIHTEQKSLYTVQQPSVMRKHTVHHIQEDWMNVWSILNAYAYEHHSEI